MDFPILETERLLLREWDAADAPDLYELYRHENVVRYTPITVYHDIQRAIIGAQRFRDRFREKNSGIVWAIELKETGRIIGECGMNQWEVEHKRTDIGYSFNPEYWGKGYAYEAVSRLIYYALNDFPNFEINRLEAYTDPRNTASIKLLEKLGFTKEGHLRQREIEKGEVVDSVIYAMLRSDYKK